VDRKYLLFSDPFPYQLEEKKKLDQLRKEKEEERQLQELQRLQEEKTGKKRTEKLEWMYATPATGNSQNPNDLEDYLLGKKRVDKMLTADENAKVSLDNILHIKSMIEFNHRYQLGASHKSFIAVQNANSIRDIAAKIREDPLLAIKQQEQAAYQALLSNPLRLREMQERNGIKPKKSKEEKKREKEERKRLKHELKHQRLRSPSYDDRHMDRRSLSYEDYHHSRRSHSPYGRPSRSPGRSRSHTGGRRYDHPSPRRINDGRSPELHRRRSRSPVRDDRMPPSKRVWPRSDESDDDRNGGTRDRVVSHAANGKRYRSRSRSPRVDREPELKRFRATSPPPRHESSQHTNASDDRAARLAAMSSNAVVMSTERQQRLSALLEKEKAELAVEEQARAKSKGMGGFLSHEQKKVFGGSGGLEERIRRGRGGMVVDND
jgi:hypothetical protein